MENNSDIANYIFYCGVSFVIYIFYFIFTTMNFKEKGWESVTGSDIFIDYFGGLILCFLIGPCLLLFVICICSPIMTINWLMGRGFKME